MDQNINGGAVNINIDVQRIDFTFWDDLLFQSDNIYRISFIPPLLQVTRFCKSDFRSEEKKGVLMLEYKAVWIACSDDHIPMFIKQMEPK